MPSESARCLRVLRYHVGAGLTHGLLRRVFAIDIMTCPHCQGAMRVKSIATEASEIQAILGAVPRARPPPPLRQLELDFAAA